MADAKKADKTERALQLSNEIFDLVDEDGSGSMEFDEFATWAKTDGRPLEWLEEYCAPLLRYMDDVELTGAQLHAEAAANGFSADLQRELLGKFRAESKANRMDEEGFVEIILELMMLKKTDQSKAFGSRMFRFFDDDGGGAVDWQEFGCCICAFGRTVAGLSMVCRGSKVERLRCVYSLIDKRARGNINRKEMRDFVHLFWLTPPARINDPDKPDPNKAARKVASNPRYIGLSKDNIISLCEEERHKIEQYKAEIDQLNEKMQQQLIELERTSRRGAQVQQLKAQLNEENEALLAAKEDNRDMRNKLFQSEKEMEQKQDQIQRLQGERHVLEKQWLALKRQSELDSLERASVQAYQTKWKRQCERESSAAMAAALIKEAQAVEEVGRHQTYSLECERLVRQCAVRILKGAMSRQRQILFARLLQRWFRTVKYQNNARVRLGKPQLLAGGTPVGYMTTHDTRHWAQDRSVTLGWDARAHSTALATAPTLQTEQPERPPRRTRCHSALPRKESRTAIGTVDYMHTTWPLAPSQNSMEFIHSTSRVSPTRQLYDNPKPAVAIPKVEANAKLKHLCLKMLIDEH